jgi:hypothetical protein
MGYAPDIRRGLHKPKGERVRTVYAPAVLEGFEWALPVDTRDCELFLASAGQRCAETWTPLEMYLLKVDDSSGKRFAYSDCPWFGSHTPILRRPAVEALASLVERDAELLPLTCPEAELVALHTYTVLDALDVDQSDIVRFPSSGRVMAIRSYVFRPDALENVVVFKLPQYLRGCTFVTQPYVDAVERAGLVGVGFKRLWSEDQ